MQVVKRYKSICIEQIIHRSLPTAGSIGGVYWRDLLEIDPGGEQNNYALWKCSYLLQVLDIISLYALNNNHV